MKKFRLILICLFEFTLSSCIIEDLDTYKFKGQILNGTTGEVYVGMWGDAQKVRGDGIFYHSEALANNMTTDSNGVFKFQYSATDRDKSTISGTFTKVISGKIIQVSFSGYKLQKNYNEKFYDSDSGKLVVLINPKTPILPNETVYFKITNINNETKIYNLKLGDFANGKYNIEYRLAKEGDFTQFQYQRSSQDSTKWIFGIVDFKWDPYVDTLLITN